MHLHASATAAFTFRIRGAGGGGTGRLYTCDTIYDETYTILLSTAGSHAYKFVTGASVSMDVWVNGYQDNLDIEAHP